MVETSLDATLVILLNNRRGIVALRDNAGLLSSQPLDGLSVNDLTVRRCQLRLNVSWGVHFIHQY